MRWLRRRRHKIEELERLFAEGQTLCEQGAWREAMSQLEEGLAISRDVGDRAREGAALYVLGVCYRAVRNLPEAVNHFEQAVTVFREIGDRQREEAVAKDLDALTGLAPNRPFPQLDLKGELLATRLGFDIRHCKCEDRSDPERIKVESSKEQYRGSPIVHIHTSCEKCGNVLDTYWADS